MGDKVGDLVVVSCGHTGELNYIEQECLGRYLIKIGILPVVHSSYDREEASRRQLTA